MAITKSRQISSLLPIAWLFISIIGGGCATTEKQPSPGKSDSAKVSIDEKEGGSGDKIDGDDGNYQFTDEDMGELSTKTETVTVVDRSSDKNKKNNDNSILDPKDGKKPVKVDYYQLDKGEVVKNDYPLPDLISFTHREFSDGKVIREYRRYRGWDFNRDGLIDMLEELVPNGDVLSRSYDFTFDGIPDHSE